MPIYISLSLYIYMCVCVSWLVQEIHVIYENTNIYVCVSSDPFNFVIIISCSFNFFCEFGAIFSKMEGGKNSHHVFQDSWLQYEANIKNEERCESSSSATSASSIGEDSDASNGSSITSSDTVDDASSSSSSSLNSSCSGALYDLSEIMDKLPIKRGLSQFYQGKSESFTSLSRVTSIEDLMKKAATPYSRNLKASKSCGTGLHSYKQYTLPKATISKKASRGVSLSSFPSRRGSFISSKPPLHQDLEC